MQLKKFKLSVDNFQLVEKLNPSALQQGVDTDLTLNLQNCSNKDFTLNQLSIDLYTPSGKILAQQLNPLPASVQLISKKVNKLTISHHISSTGLINLLKETKLIDEDESLFNVAVRLLTMDLSRVEITAKGFAEIEGVTIDFNETFNL